MIIGSSDTKQANWGQSLTMLIGIKYILKYSKILMPPTTTPSNSFLYRVSTQAGIAGIAAGKEQLNNGTFHRKRLEKLEKNTSGKAEKTLIS